MNKKIGYRELKRKALLSAIQLLNDADFDVIFDDETLDRIYEQQDGDELAQRAQWDAVDWLRKRVKVASSND